MKKFEKLVRDGIVAKIRQKGEIAAYRRASDEEFPALIGDKVVEEAKEIRAAIYGPKEQIVEEIADLCEALDELLATCNVSLVEVLQEQARKRRERGGFNERWILNVL